MFEFAVGLAVGLVLWGARFESERPDRTWDRAREASPPGACFVARVTPRGRRGQISGFPPTSMYVTTSSSPSAPGSHST
jgi:hypothetical protein